MRKIYLFATLILLTTTQAFGQYTWNGSMSNDFTVAANWTPNRNAPAVTDILTVNTTAPVSIENIGTQTIAGVIVTGAFPVSLVAASPISVLTINGATPVTLAPGSSLLASTFLTLQLNSATSVSTGTFGIEANTGGKIVINSSLTLSGTGTLSFDVPGTGGTTINGTGIINYTAGTFLCVTQGAISFQTGAVYNHAINGGVIPAATWAAGSFCNITGTTTVAPTGIDGIDFANFSWSCGSQAASVDLLLPAAIVNINGNLSIINTNGNFLRLASATSGTLRAATYTQTGGNLMIQSMGGINTLTVTGSFSQTGGIIDGVGNAAGGTAILDFKGDVTKSATTTWQSSSANAATVVNVQFSGTGPQAVSLSGTWNAPAGGRSNITITNRNVPGVNLAAGSVLKVVNTNSPSEASCTMAGYISQGNASSVVAYSGAGAGGLTLIYQGTFFQTATAAEFPVANPPKSLTINNPLGVKFPVSFNRTLTGTLTMLNGNLAVESNTLALTNPTLSAQLVRTGGSITTGFLSRLFPATGLPTGVSADGLFPFGTGVNNRSLNIYFSSSNITTGGTITVTHNPVANVNSPLSIVDGAITIDRATNTNWQISTSGGFALGGSTASLTVVGENIGAVDDYNYLHLTDLTPNYGTFVATTGTNAIPVLTKTALSQAAINKTIYVGSDHTVHSNPLVIVTFTWTGAGANGNWNNAANWTCPNALGYPSAPTENAIISSTSGFMPVINTGVTVSVYQLTLTAPMVLNMAAGSSLSVYDQIPLYSGTTNFDPASSFGYASSNTLVPQNIIGNPWIYGNLNLSGTAQKSFPATITVTGSYDVTGNATPVFNNNNFIYAGAGTQNIAQANYYDLTITGNRGGGIVTLGKPPYNATIDIAHNFDVSGVSNYNHYPPNAPLNSTIVNFSNPGPTTIPGFWYPIITNSAGDRIFDGLGSTQLAHVINCRSQSRGTGTYTVAGSKINYYVTGTASPTYTTSQQFYDLEISGNLNNFFLDFFPGRLNIQGNFTVSLTNYQQKANTGTYFIFNGTGDQTVNGFKTVAATNTPAFKYPNIIIEGGNRNVTLGGIDTIKITGSLQVPRTASYVAAGGFTVNPFSAAKGFYVAGSTVNFSVGSGLLPTLKPASGTINYNNVTITGGNRILEASMQFGGNLTVDGADLNALTGVAPATLVIGNGSASRTLDVLGDTVTVNGTSATSQLTGQIDLNTGTTGSTTMNLSGSLFINGRGQIMATGETNGNVIFKGTKAHNYSKTSGYTNDFVNFTVGDGVTSSKLTLLSNMDLIGSGVTPATTATLSVLATDTLDCKTANIYGAAAANFAKFDLKANATLVTTNTGGVEGAATSSSLGSIRNNALLVRNYDPLASYIFNASSATNTSFPGSPATFPMANLTLGDSINAATFTLNKAIAISSALTLRKFADFDLSASDVTLISTATNTARVAEVPANANITYSGTGRVNVERYYPARRAWRLVTSPLSSTGNVYSTWQDNGGSTPNRGTYVTGNPAIPAVNGLDPSTQNNASLKEGTTLTSVLNTYTTLLSTAATSSANKAFFLFVRGDRTPANLFTTSWNNTTLSSRGKLQTGSQAFDATVAAAGGLTMIGNPYASPVDFAKATRTNLDNVLYVWDPNLGGTNNVGGYVLLDDMDNDGNYTATPSSPGGLTNILQSSQAFIVRATTAGAASLTFGETNKSNVNNITAFRPAKQPKMMRINLHQLEQNDSAVLTDGVLVQFDNDFSAGIDNMDALKLGNVNEMLSIQKATTTLTLERRPDIADNDTTYLKLTRTKQRNYRLEFVPANFGAGITPFIEDSYTNTKTALSTFGATNYNFTVNGDAKSSASDRFKIVFKTAGFNPLPVTFKSIKAYQQSTAINVEWNVENEINIRKYEIEKSIDGVKFSKIYATPATGINGSSADYKFADATPSNGSNFYRIAYYNLDGSFEYSRTVMVNITKAAAGVSIYPNPVTGNNVGLALTNLEKGIYSVRLINTNGQVLMTKQLNHNAGSSIETLTPASKLTTGVYQLEVIAPNKKVTTVKVLVK